MVEENVRTPGFEFSPKGWELMVEENVSAPTTGALALQYNSCIILSIIHPTLIRGFLCSVVCQASNHVGIKFFVVCFISFREVYPRRTVMRIILCFLNEITWCAQ